MIIEMLLNAIYNIMSVLLILDIPQMPETVNGYIETAFEYIVAGGGLLANYVPLPYLIVLFGILLAVDAGILVYHFVMWILKKIPMLGLS